MMNRLQSVLSWSFLAGCLTLASCAATPAEPQTADKPAGIHEISALYERVTAHHRRQYRKPIQDQQARDMRLLAEKTESFLAATAGWENDARLTAAGESEKDAAQAKVRDFRSALEGLKDAASRKDMKALEDRYTTVMATYRNVASVVKTTE
jgi:hypothetical protein